LLLHFAPNRGIAARPLQTDHVRNLREYAAVVAVLLMAAWQRLWQETTLPQQDLVEFFSEGPQVRMLVTIEPHRDEEWTQRAGEGFASQLNKVPAALAARGK
jgi:hypothetical protein